MDYLRCICHYILLTLVAGYGISIVASQSSCPTGKFVEQRAQAVEAVQGSVRSVFSKVLNDTTITNKSLSSVEVYEHITSSVGVSATPTGFVQFQEAISEVIVAKLGACLTIDKSKITADYVSKLTKRFVALTDAKNASLAREVYGELLCIQDLLSFSDKSRKK